MKRILANKLEAFEILGCHEAKSEITLEEFRDESCTLMFLRQFLHDHFIMATLRKFLAEETFCTDVSRMSDQDVLEQIAWLLVSGGASLAVLPMKTPLALDGGAIPKTEPLAPPPPIPAKPAKFAEAEEDEKRTSWIEIELVGEDDKPIPYERYEITMPNGKTVAKGWLDERGFAHKAGIEQGTCQVCFPDLDKDACEKI